MKKILLLREVITLIPALIATGMAFMVWLSIILGLLWLLGFLWYT